MFMNTSKYSFICFIRPNTTNSGQTQKRQGTLNLKLAQESPASPFLVSHSNSHNLFNIPISLFSQSFYPFPFVLTVDMDEMLFTYI